MAATDLLAGKTTNVALTAAADGGKVHKLSDGDGDGAGLVLEARPTGASSWRPAATPARAYGSEGRQSVAT